MRLLQHGHRRSSRDGAIAQGGEAFRRRASKAVAGDATLRSACPPRAARARSRPPAALRLQRRDQTPRERRSRAGGVRRAGEGVGRGGEGDGRGEFQRAAGFRFVRPALRRAAVAVHPADDPARRREAAGRRSSTSRKISFHLHNRGTDATLVDDAKASDGKAARMPAAHSQWAVQLHLADDDEVRSARGRGSASSSCASTTEAGHARQRVRLSACTTSRRTRYIARDAGRARSCRRRRISRVRHHASTSSSPAMYFWVSPPGSDKKVEGGLRRSDLHSASSNRDA